MSDRFLDQYWIEEFQVTEADLDRIAGQVRETGQAYDLTALARRLVRGRLRHGPESSAPVDNGWLADFSVRLWDPAKDWEQGDHAIVTAGHWSAGERWYEPMIGEVIDVRPGKVSIHLDALDEVRDYQAGSLYGRDVLERWRRHVEDIVAKKRAASDLASQVEYVILEHGERVTTRLLGALRGDDRFVRLAGRWFLRELAEPATDKQLASLAWAMVPLEEPQSTSDLIPLVHPPLAGGDPGLFGLYLAMRKSDLFENADPRKRPRWMLSGPPPGTCTAEHAAYDPKTYEILCLPGETVAPEYVSQLWHSELLRAVVGSS